MFVFLFFFIIVRLPVGHTLDYANTLYVSSNCNDTLCCTQSSTPCCSLSWIVNHCLQNDTEVIFKDETYDLKETITIIGYDKIALKSSGQVTVIKCESDTGLSFIDSCNIIIENMEFTNCGTLQNSTSHDHDDDDSEVMFKQTYVAIYFQFCFNIDLILVKVTKSSGIGVVILASGGNNSIQNSRFTGNVPKATTHNGGGGLQIEFPYCSPKDQTVCNVMLDSEYNSNAVYNIIDCTFEGNIALPYMEPSYYQFLAPMGKYHSSIGHGGALALHFCKASNIVVTINGTIIDNNQAYYGAGISCNFEEHSINNTLLISGSSAGDNSSCIISNNRGIYHDDYPSKLYGSGGGLRVLFWFSYLANHSRNSLYVTKCHFRSNEAHFGGATLIKASPETTQIDPTNFVLFSDCEWTFNGGIVGGVVFISAFNESVKRGALLMPIFEGCTIRNNHGTFAVDHLPIAFKRSIDFIHNNNMSSSSAVLTVDNSVVEFRENCQANFTNNKASYGGALSLFGHAFLRVFKNTSFLFWKNYAKRDGGAIHQSITTIEVVRNGPCFIQYYDRTIPPNEWNTSFIFESNQENIRTANPECNSIILGSVVPCIWKGYVYKEWQSPDVLLHAICKEWKSFFRFRSTGCNLNCINGSTADCDYCTQHIHTLPNQLNSTKSSLVVTPGQPAELGIKILDDFGTNIFNQSVLNVWTANHTVMNLSIDTFYLTGDTLTMYGDSSENYSDHAQLYIDTLPPRPLFIPITITFRPCPPGFIQRHRDENVSATCECKSGFHGNVMCNGADVALLRNGYWIGKLDEDDSEYVVGYTSYFTTSTDFSATMLLKHNYSDSALNDLICGPLNRKGILCGRCKDGYIPPIHGYTLNKCIKKCDSKEGYSWIPVLLYNLLPVTIFLIVVLIFNVSATSGAMNFFVFFAQVITQSFSTDASGSIEIPEGLKVLSYLYNTLYSLWRLDIEFPQEHTCFYNLQAPAPLIFLIYYGQALYTIVFIGIFLLFVRLHDHGVQPFYSCGKWLYEKLRHFRRPLTVQRSVIHALATFLVLSFTKITAASFILLASSELRNHDGEIVKFVPLYYGDSSDAEYGGFIIVALVFLTIFVILPMVLLLFLPTKTTVGRLVCDNVFKLCCINPQNTKLQEFLQVFQGTFKDGSGSDNEINCQKFAGLYLLLRFLIFMLAAYLPTAWFLLGQQFLVTLAIVMIAIFQPYRKRIYNVIDILAFFMLSTINLITIFHEIQSALQNGISPILLAIQYFLVFLPLLIMTAFIFWKTMDYCCGSKIKQMKHSLLWKHRAGTTTDNEFLAFIADTGERQRENRYG